MRETLIVMLVAVYAAFGCPDSLLPGDSPYLCRAVFYPLFHANLWHLAVNCIAAWGVFKPERTNRRDIFAAIIISFLVYPLALRPVVGISNILYAAIGLRTPSLRSRWWKQPAVIVFLVVTVGMLAVPQFSATTHIAAFAFGVGIQIVRRRINSIMRDVRI